VSEAPRPAATVVLIRDREIGIEVLMALRTHRARFMASAWVFPGGAVDAQDARAPIEGGLAGDALAWAAAALREAAEELGIWVTTSGIFSGPPVTDVYSIAADREWVLDIGSLVWFANWVTPLPSPRRFDTRFFAVAADAEPHVDGDELVEAEWITPSEALRRAVQGSWLVAFPTMRTLELIASFATTSEVMEELRSLGDVPRIQPRLVVDGGAVKVLLPGEDGFDAAAEGEKDPGLLDRIGEVAAAGGDVPAEMRPPARRGRQ